MIFLIVASPLAAQNSSTVGATRDSSASIASLPDAPFAAALIYQQDANPSPIQKPQQISPGGQPSTSNPAPMDTPVPVHPSHFLTLGERFRLQAHTTFSPEAVVFPAAEAGIAMAHSPRRYPRDWSDGGAAFARNYGSTVGGRTAGGLTDFAVAWIGHEDPRYFRSLDDRPARRIEHAVVFTFFDRMNSGHRTLAISNFAAASASGFICNLWQPDDFNDTAHALQRSERGFAALVAANLVAEFSPELTKLMHKAHLPDSVANAILPRSF